MEKSILQEGKLSTSGTKRAGTKAQHKAGNEKDDSDSTRALTMKDRKGSLKTSLLQKPTKHSSLKLRFNMVVMPPGLSACMVMKEWIDVKRVKFWQNNAVCILCCGQQKKERKLRRLKKLSLSQLRKRRHNGSKEP
eukprot:1154344-Pelagomonas_calceolata.AAC.13